MTDKQYDIIISMLIYGNMKNYEDYISLRYGPFNLEVTCNDKPKNYSMADLKDEFLRQILEVAKFSGNITEGN